MKKRLISILLSLCMVLTLLPATVLSAGEGTSKAGNATFTLSVSSASCAEGHTGELGSIQVTGVDISKWKSDKKITLQYDVQYRCTDSSCELYDSGDSFFSYSGKHTFVDTNAEFCHKKISESFTATISTDLTSGGAKNFSVSFMLTSDKGISEIVRHDYEAASACTEWFYSTRCWECTGCDSFFTSEDCADEYKIDKDMLYFPPVGHKLNNVPAKDPTCVAKGTVEYWHCERCDLNFSDEEGKNELTNIETDAPLLPHSYDDNGVCSVCSFKAAAKVLSKDGNKWYDNIADAITALDAEDAYRIEIGKDCDETITISNAREVYINKGVTVTKLEATDAEGCVVTVVNDGTIKELNGYTGKVVLMSAEGTYGKVINQTGGNVGSFLYSDPEDANKFCYYKNLSNGKWILPAEATANTLSNVKVSYSPMAYIEIAGDGITGSEGSYAFTTNSGNTVAFTATAKTADGKDSTNVSYKWYYDGQDGTILSEKAELTIENIKAGNRTVICMATADDYSISAKLVLTVTGEKESQNFTLSVSKTTVGIREKILPLLSIEGIKEDAAITYYLMNGTSPAPESDTVIDENFAFAQVGTGSIYAYAAETDNYAATASAPVPITVTPHADHCICGGAFNHTHENVEWQAWDGKSAIDYEVKWIPISGTGELAFKVAYVYLTGNVSANMAVGPRQILYLCLNGYSFTCADPSQPAIKLAGEKGWPAELNLCDCGGTGTLGGSNASGGSIYAAEYANVNFYSGTLTGNNVSGDGGAVAVKGNCSFTMYGGAITGNTATGNGGGIYATSGSVTINGGVISNNQATNGGGIYVSSGAQFRLSGGEINGNTAANEGGGVYCSSLYSQNGGRCEFYGGTISGNTAKQGGGAYVRVCYIGYRNCRITGNTATEAGGGLYLEPYASEKLIYIGNVYGGSDAITPYIYDNTVDSAQNNLYLSDPDTQIKFTARINTSGDAKIGVYFTGITSNGASVLLNYLQVNTESSAKLYLDRIFCDNPDFGRLEIRKDENYYNLYLINTSDEVTITFDPTGGTLNAGEESKLVQPDSPYGTLPTPTRAGYRFDGWFTAIDGGEKVEETTVMSSRAAHTLYAHWTLLHEHCICGGDVTTGDHTAHTSQVFSAWNGTDAISYTNKTAYVYLAQNATISSNLDVDGTTLYLCLNGNTFASNGTNKITVSNGGRLVICDCKGSGTIKGATSGWGGSCVYLYQSTLDIFGGTITGGKVDGNGGGGAIALDDSKCIMNMYGGEISGNNGNKSGGAIFLNNKDKKGGTVNIYGGLIANNSAQNGGVIYSSCGGTVNLVGGTISGNKATSGDGGVINMSGGTITISGTKLINNTASRYGGGIYVNPSNNGQLKISGNPVVKDNTASGTANNVYLPSGKKLSINAAMSSGASIGITTESKNYPVVFSGKYSQDYSDYFFADAANAHVNYNSNTELELAAGEKKYNVYVLADTNGTATVSASSATAGTTIRLTATPNNGYHFKEWQVVSGNAEISNYMFIMPAGDVTVKPVFEAHSFTEERAEEQYKKSSADCTHNDVYYKTCSCGAVSTTETFEVPGTALNHDWAEATCTEPKTCRREGCGATDGNPLDHDLPNDWSKDENEHWHECKRCHSKEDAGEHEYGDDNICDICGYDKTVPHTHNLTLVTANAATCTKNGNKAYYTCGGCDMWFEDANGSIEITDKTTVIIPATGHAPSASWKFDKADHWKDCTNAGCGTIIDGSKAAHTESGWIIDTAPTYFKSGTQHKECTVCHYVTAVGFIPARGGDIEPSNPSNWTPNPNLPATGDDNTAFSWIALLLICASTAAGTIIYGRRKKQR